MPTEDPKALAERVLAELQDAQDGGPYDEECRRSFGALETLARAVLDYAKRATACPACMTQDRLRLERDEARAEVRRLKVQKDSLFQCRMCEKYMDESTRLREALDTLTYGLVECWDCEGGADISDDEMCDACDNTGEVQMTPEHVQRIARAALKRDGDE